MINKNCKIPQSKQEFLSQMVEGTPKLQSFVACFVVFKLCVSVLCELRKWKDRAERMRESFLLVCVCVVEVCWKFFLFWERGGPRVGIDSRKNWSPSFLSSFLSS